MNRIYQVIWSEARHMYVVVSEIARRHSKNTTSVNTSGARQSLLTSIKKGGQSAAAALAVIAMIGFVSPGVTYAEDNTGTTDPKPPATPVDIGNGATIVYTPATDPADEDKTIGGTQDLIIGKDNHLADDQSGSRNVVTGTDNTAQHVDEDGNAQPLYRYYLIDVDGNEIPSDDKKGVNNTVVSGNGAVAEANGDTSIGDHAKITNEKSKYYADQSGHATKDIGEAAYYVDRQTGKPTTTPQVYRTGYDEKTGNASAISETTTDPQYVHTLTQTIIQYDKDGNQVGEPKVVTVHEVNGNGDKITNRDPVPSEKAADGSYTVTTTSDETNNPSLNYLKADQINDLYSKDLYEPSTNSVAIGTDAHVKGRDGVAEGHNAKAGGAAVAVGYSASAEGAGVAVGPVANAGKDAQAIGELSYATENSSALGMRASAQVSGGVALGADSQAIRDAKVFGWDPKTQAQAVEADHPITDPVWYSNRASVSVGYSREDGTPVETRQITNVAAGRDDSDAVNVAQLKRAVEATSPHYYSWNDNGKPKDNYLKLRTR